MISSFLFLSLFSSSSLLCSCLRSSSFKSSIQQSCYINKRSLYSTSPSSYSFVLHSTSVDDPPKSTSLRTKSNVTKAVIACTAVTSNLGLYKHASASSSPTPTSSTNTHLSVAAAVAIILASKIHELKPLTASNFPHFQKSFILDFERHMLGIIGFAIFTLSCPTTFIRHMIDQGVGSLEDREKIMSLADQLIGLCWKGN